MQCISCNSNVDPTWKFAIEQNNCPFCGSNIVDTNLRDLLILLRDTLDKLKDFPEQLNDWMLSNYNFIRTDAPNISDFCTTQHGKSSKKEDPESKKYTVKIKTDKGEEEVQVEKVQSEEKTSEFFARAEVTKKKDAGTQAVQAKTQRLKTLVEQIKKNGSPIVTEDDVEAMKELELNSEDNMSAAELAEMQAMIAGEHINSSLPNEDEEEIPAAVLAMARHKNNTQGSNRDAQDLIRLQRMQDKARSKFEGGGGSFSRG